MIQMKNKSSLHKMFKTYQYKINVRKYKKICYLLNRSHKYLRTVKNIIITMF